MSDGPNTKAKPMQSKTLGRKAALAHSPIHKHPKIEPSNPSLGQHIQKVGRVRKVHVDVCRPMCEQKVGVVKACDIGYRRCIVSPWVPGRRSHESFREHGVLVHNVNAGISHEVCKGGRGKTIE